MEHDGILIRVSGYGSSTGEATVVYDRLAGHIVADALLEQREGDVLHKWLHQEDTVAALASNTAVSHPLAGDILIGLVGLMPRRNYRRQLWPLLQDPLRTEALHEAASLEACFLDGATVSELATLVAKTPPRHRDLLDRLWMTRSARNHPLDADFLDAVLRAMPMPDRDLRWTEWLRRRRAELVEDVKEVEERWDRISPGDRLEALRARWVMWTLTSTARSLRDHATRALYTFGCNDPTALFDLTLDSIAVNDAYVPERMLAACYGVAMSMWAHPQGEVLRSALPGFATALIDQMFVPGAPHSTCHVLMRDSALGLIALARRVSPECIGDDKLRYTVSAFEQLLSPFPDPSAIADNQIVDAHSAIGMDFGNYTIGHLIPDRHNYDDRHPTYQEVRRQIEARIIALGYSSSRFQSVDAGIAEDTWRRHGRRESRIDRYGKKYSWIAYFEMYGLRSDKGQLAEWRGTERSPEVDIDPSFPQPARIWTPALPDLFAESTRKPELWIAEGPTPDYDHLLSPTRVDGQPGPWVLLDGYVEQSSLADDRRIFTLFRGVLVSTERADQLLSAFHACPYPGNDAIPEPMKDYYTYAGEIPWSTRFGSAVRSSQGEAQRDLRSAFHYHDGSQWQPGVPVEVPVCSFAWESHHSALNLVSGAVVPAPAVCQRFGLVNRRGEWDLYDATGHLASMYRESKREPDDTQLAYIRCDLLAEYLDATRQVLIWMLWGERGFHHRADPALRPELDTLLSQYVHIHRKGSSWPPELRANE